MKTCSTLHLQGRCDGGGLRRYIINNVTRNCTISYTFGHWWNMRKELLKIVKFYYHWTRYALKTAIRRVEIEKQKKSMYNFWEIFLDLLMIFLICFWMKIGWTHLFATWYFSLGIRFYYWDCSGNIHISIKNEYDRKIQGNSYHRFSRWI